jgi:NitT/TauT family transport system permease protein
VGYRLRQAADLIQTDQVLAWTITMVAMMAALEMGVLKPLENIYSAGRKRPSHNERRCTFGEL